MSMYTYVYTYFVYILFRFICTFLTKAACCRNIEIVLHTTTLSIFNVLWCDASSTYYIHIYIYIHISDIFIYIYIYLYIYKSINETAKLMFKDTLIQ